MGERIYTAEEAEALAAAATPGPWRWRSFPGDACDAIWSGPDEGEGAACVLDLGDDEPYEARCGEVRTTADADLLSAAPDLARSVAHHARRADEAEAEVARLRAIIAAERGLAAPDGWEPNGEGWSRFVDEWGDDNRHARPVGRGAWNGQEFLSGTWWEWSVDERIGGLLAPGRRGRGYAPTALEAMEAADAAAGVTRG